MERHDSRRITSTVPSVGFFAGPFEHFDRGIASVRVIDDRVGIFRRVLLAARVFEFGPGMDDIGVDTLEFGNVGRNVFGGRIVALSLSHRIEDPEIWLGVRPGRSGPLPPADIVCGFVIQKVPSEPAISLTPIEL